jgi:hypothetical protein
MRQLASNIIAALGSYWGGLGWITFIFWLIVPLMTGQLLLALPLLVPWLLWWIIDVINQRVPPWTVLAGVAMILVVFLPYGWIVTCAAWVMYWTKVRD